MDNSQASTKPDLQDLVIERIFDAPRELVWKAWTEPERLMRWWGPKDFTAPFCQMDFREGGEYLWCMQSPDGQKIWSGGVYKEVVPINRFSYTYYFADEDGNRVSSAAYGMGDDLPEETLITVTFEDLGSKTKMTLIHGSAPAGEMMDSARQGWNESFDKLAATLN